MQLIGSALIRSITAHLSRANGSTPKFLCFILGVGVGVCILYLVPNVAYVSGLFIIVCTYNAAILLEKT